MHMSDGGARPVRALVRMESTAEGPRTACWRWTGSKEALVTGVCCDLSLFGNGLSYGGVHVRNAYIRQKHLGISPCSAAVASTGRAVQALAEGAVVDAGMHL